jgi:hypothetical protein
MNLHAIVAGAITTVNPFQTASVRQSSGFTKAADFSQVPAYVTTDNVPVQVQPITGKDLKMMDAVNIQAIDYALYLNGSLLGVSRPLQVGGDLMRLNGKVYKVTIVLETWPTGWCKVGVTLQNEAPW